MILYGGLYHYNGQEYVLSLRAIIIHLYDGLYLTNIRVCVYTAPQCQHYSLV
jgi:hypothetical protein